MKVSTLILSKGYAAPTPTDPANPPNTREATALSATASSFVEDGTTLALNLLGILYDEYDRAEIIEVRKNIENLILQ